MKKRKKLLAEMNGKKMNEGRMKVRGRRKMKGEESSKRRLEGVELRRRRTEGKEPRGRGIEGKELGKRK